MKEVRLVKYQRKYFWKHLKFTYTPLITTPRKHLNATSALGNWRKVTKRMTLKTNVKFTFVMVLTWGICNMQPREWWRFQRCPQMCIICICSLRHLTIFCQHFWRFCINIFNDSWFAGKLVEGTNCSERALLPEKSLREKLNQLIEDDFSKVTLVSTIKYFKQKSGKNECVDATIKILEHVKKENDVPNQNIIERNQEGQPNK